MHIYSKISYMKKPVKNAIYLAKIKMFVRSTIRFPIKHYDFNLVQQKKHCPIFLTQGLRCRDTEQKRCVFGLTKEPDQLHARSSDVIIRSSTNKFLSIWRGSVTDQALSPVNSGRTLITYSLSKPQISEMSHNYIQL